MATVLRAKPHPHVASSTQREDMPRYACRVISVGFVLCMFTGCAPAPITSADSQRPIPAARPSELIPSKGSDLSSESWRYAQWGMTPSQVVAASAGRATLLKGKSERGSAEDTKRFDEMQRISRENNISLSLLDQYKGATSSITVGGLELDISFMFNGRNDRLVSVLLGKSDCTSDELDKLALLLTLKFGKPFEHYRTESIGYAIWKWSSAPDLIELASTKDADKSSSTCIISYEPISTSGL